MWSAGRMQGSTTEEVQTSSRAKRVHRPLVALIDKHKVARPHPQPQYKPSLVGYQGSSFTRPTLPSCSLKRYQYMTSSSPRPASPSSSNNSIWNKELTLDQLVTHFVASKRSLSSTSHVWQANQIVTGARDCLEENALLKAKNAFLHGALDEQLLALEAVSEGVQMVGAEGEEEFQVCES